MIRFKDFIVQEESPTNNAGSGNVKGMGGASGEPGVKRKNPKMLLKLLRRTDPRRQKGPPEKGERHISDFL